MLENFVKCDCGKSATVTLYADGIPYKYICHRCKFCIDCGRFQSNVIEIVYRQYNQRTRRAVCANCRDRHYSQCSHCLNYFRYGDYRLLNNGNRHVCEYCIDQVTLFCSMCNDTIEPNAYYRFDRRFYCNECYDNTFTTCARCEETIYIDNSHYDDDSGENYCSNCFERLDDLIAEHGDAPRIKFFGTDPLKMGIELEVADGGYRPPKALGNFLKDFTDRLWFNDDSSVNDGFEIISQPMDLTEHKKYFWKSILSELRNWDYTGEGSNTAGIHIHINKEFLKDETGSLDKNLSKIIMFFEINWETLKTFSRRDEDQLESWANRYALRHRTININTILDYARSEPNRYKAVNITPRNTIEFRLFNSTLNYSYLMAIFEFIHSMIYFCTKFIKSDCRSSTGNETQELLKWEKYIKYIDRIKGLKYLKEYLKEYELMRPVYTENIIELPEVCFDVEQFGLSEIFG